MTPTLRDDPDLSGLTRQVLDFVKRGYREILLFALVGVLAAGFMVSQLDRSYQSTIRVMVDTPQRSPIESEQFSATLLETFVEGQVYLVEAREILSRVVERENLTDHPFYQSQPDTWADSALSRVRALISGPPSVEESDAPEMDPAVMTAVRTLRRNLNVGRERNTNVIRIDVTADTPRTAARIANAIAEVFVESRARDQSEQAVQMSGWLDTRVAELQDRLTRAEDAVAAFRVEYNMLSGTPGTLLSDQQLSEFNSELIRTRAALAERDAAYRRAIALRDAGGDMQTLPEMQSSSIVTTLRGQLLELQRREIGQAARGSANPRTSQISEERAALEDQLEAEIGRIVEQMRNEVETLQAREALVTAVLAEATGESGAASRRGVQLRDLERRAAAYQALYERYLSTGGLAEEALSFLPAGVVIVDPASISNAPVSPPVRVIMLFGLIFGGGIGTLIAFFRDTMRTGYVTARRVEEDLGLGVLASVPQLESTENAFDVATSQPFSDFAEATRTFRFAVGAAARPRNGMVLMLTSSSAGEGKTSLSAALAGSALTAGLRVLLIDADLRRSGLTRLFDMEGEEGLAEILEGKEWSFATESSDPELEILCAGVAGPRTADLLAQETLKRYLKNARNNYDLIILDGPPVANMADAPILAGLSDAVAFVIRWNVTPRDVVRKALSRLGTGRIRGVVLNGVDFKTAAQYGDSYDAYVQNSPRPLRKRDGATV